MVKKGIFIAFFIVAVVAGLSWVVMSLWNFSVAPTFSNINPIDYKQALGLLVLSKIFLWGLRGKPGGPPWKKHWRSRWNKMNDEEKQKLKEEWSSRWKK